MTTSTTNEYMIAQKLAEMDVVRARTLELFSVAPEADLQSGPGFGFRPVLWHLAHIGVFEAYWILQKLKGAPPIDDRYERLFDPIATPREQSSDLPTRAEMEAFLTRVRRDVKTYLGTAKLDDADPLVRQGYVLDLVIEHERQHQETLAYLLHLLDPERKRRPENGNENDDANDSAPPPISARESPGVSTSVMIEIPAGKCIVGATWASFAYDNELPSHESDVARFSIARLPVTNEEYARFIRDEGYARRELWSEEGWACREREAWTAPLHWRLETGGWSEGTMFGDEEYALAGEHPVSGVSWYEADAYARWAGARLPTEAEWEKAASWDERASRKRRFAWGDEEPTLAHCNSDMLLWGKSPVGWFPAGASRYGCLDMTGNVWEWTSDPFAPYAGFEAFPYPEYSEKWFDGDHRVLKGGSWATSASVLRTSFRNFFRRDFRIAFAGIRIAQ